MKLGIFSQKELAMDKWLKLGEDSFLFPQVKDIDRRMWTFVICFHLAGLALFVGHLRLIFEFTPLTAALGDRRMEQLAFWTGGGIGIILLITALYFLVRHLTRPCKEISSPGDYFLLILVLLVIVTGNYMRFFSDIPVTAYRQYVNSLLSFNPFVPDSLDTTTEKWSLGVHVIFANLLICYLPFSKVMHFAGTFATNLIRSEHLWLSSYKRP